MAPNAWDVGPWRTGPLVDPRHDPTPTEPTQLLGAVTDAAEVFSGLIRNDDGEPFQRDAASVYDDLENNHDALSAGAHRGYGRVVAAAYRASRVS